MDPVRISGQFLDMTVGNIVDVVEDGEVASNLQINGANAGIAYIQ